MFRHEDFVIDLDNSNKTKLYKNGKLVFIGDGYKAITMLIRNAEDPGPVKEKFKAQLEMREKPKFEKQTDIETLRKEAAQEEEQRKAAEKKKKVIRRPSYR
jgi:hypothetical protein